MTGLEVGGLVVVFAAGVALVIAGAPLPVANPAPQAGFPAGFGQALLFVLFAFSGWSEISTLSAEVNDAQPRHGARAGAGRAHHHRCCTWIANWALWRGLGIAGLAASKTPAADIITLAFGNWRRHPHRDRHHHGHAHFDQRDDRGGCAHHAMPRRRTGRRLAIPRPLEWRTRHSGGGHRRRRA